jgi:hypothetical protein
MNPVASAVKTLDAVLERFSDDDLRKRLTALQIAAAPAGAAPTTLRLLKPVSTRIGVKYFCLQRIVKMKPFISTIMPEITAPQWTSVENSVKALEPFAEAFLACERDDATLWTVCRQFRKLEQSIHDFEHVDGLKNFARLVKPILGGRWARQFDSDAVRALRLLDPQRQEDVSPVDKMSTLQWLKKLGNELHISSTARTRAFTTRIRSRRSSAHSAQRRTRSAWSTTANPSGSSGSRVDLLRRRWALSFLTSRRRARQRPPSRGASPSTALCSGPSATGSGGTPRTPSSPLPLTTTSSTSGRRVSTR